MTSNGELVFVRLSAVSVAVRTSPLLAVSIVQPLKVVTPAEVEGVQPERVPGPVVSVKVGTVASSVTVFPPASSTVTTGWVVKAVPPVAPAGGVVNTSWLGVPVPTTIESEVPVVRAPSAAVSV